MSFSIFGGIEEPLVFVAKVFESCHFVHILPNVRSVSSHPPPVPPSILITWILLLLGFGNIIHCSVFKVVNRPGEINIGCAPHTASTDVLSNVFGHI